MLTAIIDYKQSQRRLIICDHDSNIPYWIATLTMLFPLKLAHSLEFTTYTYEPDESNLRLCATPSVGTRFAFSELHRNFSYYIFDFINNKHSSIENKYEFYQLVPLHLAKDLGNTPGFSNLPSYSSAKPNLTTFHHFLALFDYVQINAEIDIAYHLFCLTHAHHETISLQQLIPAIQFANTYASKPILGPFFPNIRQNLENIKPKIDLNSAEIISLFVLQVAQQTPPFRQQAYQFCLTLLDSLIIEKNITRQAAFQLNDSLRAFEKNKYCHEFLEQTLNSKRLNQCYLHFANRPDLAEIYLTSTVKNLLMAGYSWEQSMVNPSFNDFLGNCLAVLLKFPAYLCEALNVARENQEFWVQLFSRAISFTDSNDTLFEALLDYFGSAIPANNAFALRLRLLALEQEEFVFKEFIKLLALAPDKVSFFWHYQKIVFATQPDFAKAYFSQAVKIYLNYIQEIKPTVMASEVRNLNLKFNFNTWIKNIFHQATNDNQSVLLKEPSFESGLVEQQTTECFKLLPHAAILDDETVIFIVQQIEANFPFSPPNVELKQQILLLSQLKKARNIKTSPDITYLMRLAILLQTKKTASLSQFFAQKLDLSGIDRERYQAYLEWILPRLFDLQPTAQEHGMILKSLRVTGIGLERKLIRQYLIHLKQLLRQEKHGNDVLINFMVYYLGFMPNETSLPIVLLHRLFWKDVVDMLTKLSNSYLEDIEDALLAAQGQTDESLEMLKNLQTEIEVQQQHFQVSLDLDFWKKLLRTNKQVF